MQPEPADDRDLPIDAPVGFWLRVAYLLGPIAVTSLVVGGLYLFAGLRVMNEVIVSGAASLFGAGTTVVFGKAAVGEELFRVDLETWHLAGVVIYINAASAFWYCYNLDLLQRVPKVGPYMRRARMNAVHMLRRRPWIRKWAVVGVGLFVVTPLPGSGALGGALVGRIVGVSKRATFIAVTVAGVIVASLYAMLAEELRQALDRLEQFVPAWARLVVFVLFAIVMFWIFAKLVRWFASYGGEAEGDVAPHERDGRVTAE